jgi:alcohol dehydrogenase, propanol-preferring
MGNRAGWAASPCHHCDGWVGLSEGEGQDAARAWWVWPAVDPAAGGLEVIDAGWFDWVLADVNPSGTRVLTTPHVSGPLLVMCRSDYQLLDGYFKTPFPVEFSYIPGHEVTGRVAGLGSEVPKTVGYSEGDMVVVNPSWGDGTCRQCREGSGRWVGFGPPGGFAEDMTVESRHAIPVSEDAAKTHELLAPMTDAGMTPYRGLRKLRDAGKLGPDRTVAVTGIGGLGSYAVQYAKLLGGGAIVVAFARRDSRLDVARENGADYGINVKDKSSEAIQGELERLTGRRTVDAILDCVGSEESISMGFDLLGPEGALAAVGLMSQQVEHRQFPFVGTELSYLGSFWGNHLDLVEVLSLAEAGHIKHNVTKVKLEDINENLEALGHGDIVGRQVIVFQ